MVRKEIEKIKQAHLDDLNQTIEVLESIFNYEALTIDSEARIARRIMILKLHANKLHAELHGMASAINKVVAPLRREVASV